MRFPRIRGGDPARSTPLRADHEVFPAYAGVIPFRRLHRFENMRFPRIRGGDPRALHRVGVDKQCFPRIRGGDPMLLMICGSASMFSPHTRG